MFCPNCGKGEQEKNTFCRKCGEFLPDYESVQEGYLVITPVRILKTNALFSLISAVLSFAMAFWLISTYINQSEVDWLKFIASQVFIVTGIWNLINYYQCKQLKKYFGRKDKEEKNSETQVALSNPAKTQELLNEADFENVVPASVTEKTTKNLTEKVKNRKST